MYIFSSYEEYCNYLKNKFKNKKYILISIFNFLVSLIILTSFILLILSGLILMGLPGLLLVPLISDITYSQIATPLIYALISFILNSVFLISFTSILNKSVRNKTDFFDYESYDMNLKNWKKICLKEKNDIIDTTIEID